MSDDAAQWLVENRELLVELYDLPKVPPGGGPLTFQPWILAHLPAGLADEEENDGA